MEDPQIKTERLLLRHFRKEDADDLHEIFSDPEAMKFWSTPPHQTLEETKKFVDETILATENGKGEDFVILFQNKIIGKMGLWNNIEIGFILSPQMWGRGFASEALKAIIKRAADRGVSKIKADVDPRNEACIKLLKKNNFIETGKAEHTLEVNGEWVDSLYFELDL